MQRHAIRHRDHSAYAARIPERQLSFLAFTSLLLVVLVVYVQGAFAQSNIAGTATYSCDFENSYCDFMEQSALGDAPPSARRSSLVSTSRSATRGVRLHTEPGDANVHGSGDWERNDILKPADSSYCNEGQEEWWAVSIMFPSDYVFPPGPGAGIVMDFHHNGSSGQANYEIQTIPGIGLRARGYGGPTLNQGQYDALIPDPYGAVANVTRNVWYDFVFHVRWSSSGNGVMEGWLNGRKYSSFSGPTLYSGMSCYLKLANYHAPFGAPSSVIYDRIVRGTSAADVALTALDGAPGTPALPTGATYTLSSVSTGGGSGTIASSPAGLSCSSSCSASFSSGSVVTLNASASSGSTFAGWSGACSGTGMCSISMGSNQSVTAVFTGTSTSPTPTGTLPVSGGIDASAYQITAGQSVSFTAKVTGNSGAPTGTVAFTDNGNAMAGCTSVAISGGAATCNTSSLVAGSHAIRASYSGNSTYGSGIMGPITETVNAAASGVTPASAPGSYNVQGLWWQPRESGWGVDLAQQGDVVFATLFTYDTQGNGQWLVMSGGVRVGDNAYSGPLYRTTGPAYDAGNFDPANVRYTEVGTAYLSFTDGNNGTLAATVNGVSMTKAITRFIFASAVPTCTMDNNGAPTENFQDLWWRSGGSESGWGVNITHQGNILFATMFTYDSDGTPMWLEGSSLVQTGDGTFSGTLDRTSGPAFGSQSFDPASVSRMPVGSMTVAFSDAANGALTFSVNGVTQTKPITRFVYSTPKTTCR